MWLVKYIEESQNISFVSYGILPRTFSGLKGILTSPFIHGDYDHLISNSSPMLILGTSLFYFYRKVALKVFILLFFVTGIWVWAGSRMSFHIGASGLIYALAGFLFMSGVIRKNMQLLAISLMVVFLYGSLAWGILPYKPSISWESHLFGGIAGAVVAFFYRKRGPEDDKYDWQDEDDDDDLHKDNTLPNSNMRIVYRMKD